MSRLETKSINLNMSVIKAKDNLIKNIEKSNEFSLQNIITENENYVIFIDSKRSSKSNKGEIIEVKIEAINEEEIFITIKSELKAKLQQYDWGKNNNNIELITSFIKSGSEENSFENIKSSVLDKYRSLIATVPCVYHGGHESLTRESIGTVNVYPDKIEFTIIKKQFEIPISSIINNEIIHQEQLTQRITATRMLTFGIFAIAAPKKKNNISNYLTIEYEEKNIKSLLVFKGNSSLSSKANNLIIELNSAIIKARKNYMTNEDINQ